MLVTYGLGDGVIFKRVMSRRLTLLSEDCDFLKKDM
jgi:hypothetical protein